MSRRTSIVEALVTKLKGINGTAPYTSNISSNAYPILKFWDEVQDFPCIYVTAGSEQRDYLPGNFAWCTLNISIKTYVKGEDASLELEVLLEDIEKCIDANRELIYATGLDTTEILVQSIITDEGLLAPYAVGEMAVQVLYQKM